MHRKHNDRGTQQHQLPGRDDQGARPEVSVIDALKERYRAGDSVVGKRPERNHTMRRQEPHRWTGQRIDHDMRQNEQASEDRITAPGHRLGAREEPHQQRDKHRECDGVSRSAVMDAMVTRGKQTPEHIDIRKVGEQRRQEQEQERMRWGTSPEEVRRHPETNGHADQTVSGCGCQVCVLRGLRDRRVADGRGETFTNASPPGAQ